MMSASERGFAADTITACFSVHAVTDPGVMARVIEVFSRRGLVPSTWHSSVVGNSDEELQIDLQMNGMDATQTEVVAEALRQIVNVNCVLTSEKRRQMIA